MLGTTVEVIISIKSTPCATRMLPCGGDCPARVVRVRLALAGSWESEGVMVGFMYLDITLQQAHSTSYQPSWLEAAAVTI